MKWDTQTQTEITIFIVVILISILLVKIVARKSDEAESPASKPGVPAVLLLGWLLILGGLAGMVFFFLFFDTSVPVAAEIIGISRVNNLGLMQDRQNGIIISAVALIIGVLLALFARPKPQ